VRPLLILIAVLASLCMPAAALAQSAGDEQYTDPFAGQDEAPAQQGQQEPAAPPPETPAEPAPGGNGDAEAAPAGEAGGEAAQPASPTLPRTGAPVLLFAAAGYALLLGGVAIRRQV
jgi:hypothetical protein